MSMMTGDRKQAWASGGTILAATAMLIIGIYQVLVGIAAIARDTFFVITDTTRGAYYYDVDITAWGWIHVAVGAVVLVAGFFLFTGAMWARALAIGIAVVSAVANFFFLPYYPLWALLIIALDVFVIWAVANIGVSARRAAGEERAMMGTSPYAGEAGRSGEQWPAENVPGRHWAPDNVKEGVRSGDQQAREAAERASASQGGRRPNPPQNPSTGG
jgi:hypothetical protein